MSMRRKLTEKLQERTALLEKAEGLLKEGNREEYRTQMDAVKAMNGEIEEIKSLIQEQDRKFMEKAPDLAEEKDKAEERGNALMKGQEVKFSALEVGKVLFLPQGAVEKSVTLATGTLAQPTGAGTNIRDPLGNGVGAIIDQVYVQDLTGMSSYLEPYVISEFDASGADVATAAGTARTASSDPTFGVAKIAPYELTTTSYVDRNISRLTPANYYAKVYAMAIRALRRDTVKMIFNGDGQSANNDMFGIKTAKNMAGNTIYATKEVSAVDADLLTELMFAYGGDEMLGGSCRLYLNKTDLLALGKLRGTNEKLRLFDIVPDAGNPNTGTIRDGGVIVPYSIASDLNAITGANAASAAVQTMVYGDPMNYELGLFGDYTVRVDESVKAVERMLTILGDAMVGGNLIVDKGFVVATVPQSGT